MLKNDLGDRMKTYESSYRIYLPNRLPVIMRVDGKSFTNYTKGCKRPFDEKLVEVMNDTAAYLCKNIQGAQIAYVQSDEISILLNNYKSLDTQPWFENNLQKMASVSASMAGAIFTANSWKIWKGEVPCPVFTDIIKPAVFDSRVFVLPKEEVCNAFLWRQQDATRNSVQMLARSNFSHKQCENKNCSELQEMLFQEKKINWNDLPVSQKRGRCIVKKKSMKEQFNPITGERVMAERSEWVVDNDIPIFSEKRKYIEQYAYEPELKDLDYILETDELAF